MFSNEYIADLKDTLERLVETHKNLLAENKQLVEGLIDIRGYILTMHDMNKPEPHLQGVLDRVTEILSISIPSKSERKG